MPKRAGGGAHQDGRPTVAGNALVICHDDPHTRPLDFTGKPLKTMVYVAAKGFAADADLRKWLTRAHKFVSSLPPKS